MEKSLKVEFDSDEGASDETFLALWCGFSGDSVDARNGPL